MEGLTQSAPSPRGSLWPRRWGVANDHQLTQQWDCGRRDLFLSSGIWTPQAGWMIGDGDGGRGGGEEGRKWEGGVSGLGGWLRQRKHSLKDRVSSCCPGVLPRDLREHPT